MIDPVLRTPDALTNAVRAYREQGKTIVTTNGSFDVLHAGHVGTLSVARSAGDVVIVGLNSDVSVRSYKGPLRPIVGQEERAEVLAATMMVDHVYLFDEPECLDFVRLAAPDVHVNDAGYGPECIEAGVIAACGARLLLVHKRYGRSTSDVVRTVVNNHGQTCKPQ